MAMISATRQQASGTLAATGLKASMDGATSENVLACFLKHLQVCAEFRHPAPSPQLSVKAQRDFGSINQEGEVGRPLRSHMGDILLAGLQPEDFFFGESEAVEC